MLLKLEQSRVFDLAQSIIARYVHEEIDAAYIVYNEFKSVITAAAGGGEAAAADEDRHSADCGGGRTDQRREGTRRGGGSLGGHRD